MPNSYLVVLIGIPAAGKSSLARELKELECKSCSVLFVPATPWLVVAEKLDCNTQVKILKYDTWSWIAFQIKSQAKAFASTQKYGPFWSPASFQCVSIADK